MESLKSPRYGAGSVVNQEPVWILGGTQVDESTEFFDGIEWKSGPKLEKTLSKHCVLNWNDGKTMIIGGKQMESEMERSRHVYIGDWLTNSWTEVNPLNVPRFGHACGKFTLFNGTEVVLVAGGQTGNKMASEIRRLEMYNFQVNCSNNFESYKAACSFKSLKGFFVVVVVLHTCSFIIPTSLFY